jgi:GDP-mannose 6-dehydrogenase
VDRDDFKVTCVSEGRAPFYEPGLDELVRAGRQAGRLEAVTDLAGAVSRCDIALICVGTPAARNGDVDPLQLIRVCDELGAALRARPKPFLVAVRSTVFPRTCEEIVQPRVGGAAVVANPEFLREGSAVRDFMNPALLVAGAADRRSAERIARLYEGLPVEPCIVDLRCAELIKYACNAFHALKIGFANEVGALAGALGVSGLEVMNTLCRDTVLNVSAAYLKPGMAFGGSCLPKDLRAIECRSGRMDLKLPLLEALLPSNAEHVRRAIRAILDLPAGRLGFYGLAFKENTDDLRDSPSIQVLEHLIGKGREPRIFDPHIRLNRIYGSNQRFVLASIPHIGRLMEPDLDALLAWSEHLILMHQPTPQAEAKIRAAGVPVLDLAHGEAGVSSCDGVMAG